MFWHFVATIFCGLGLAGVALVLRHLSQNRVPRWLIPLFGGLGMLGYQIHLEYTWFELKQARLPAGTTVVSTESPGIFWRPWSFVVPQVTAFTVLDDASVTAHPALPDVKRVTLYRFERQIRDQVSTDFAVLHCGERRFVPLSADGALDTTRQRQLPPDDRLWSVVCGKSSTEGV